MTATISITSAGIRTALGNFLVSILPAAVAIVRAQDNRVPEPSAADFIVMTEILRERIETNRTTYYDGALATPPTAGVRYDVQATKVTMQLDIHGPNSPENTQVIMTLFRSDMAADFFAGTGFDVSPLYTSDPLQVPFIDGEQQYEDRWTLDVAMQINPVVTTPQQFAAQIHVGLIEVETTYPG